MKITNTEVYGIEASIRGMRNPLDSWKLSDTRYMSKVELDDKKRECEDSVVEGVLIGEKDIVLAKKLINAGTEHCKFLRQIQVWADMDFPRYIWAEYDTYKFNSKNSCSTMHTIMKKSITLDNFYYASDKEKSMLIHIINELNSLREEYIETKDYNVVISMKRLLPESFIQKRTVNANYAELINIYHQRKNHRLKEEWGTICKWIESLPYMKDFLDFK